MICEGNLVPLLLGGITIGGTGNELGSIEMIQLHGYSSAFPLQFDESTAKSAIRALHLSIYIFFRSKLNVFLFITNN